MSMDLFKAPIPGQSLTQTPGGAPWEHPPQFTDVNMALEYLFEKLTDTRQVIRLVLVVKRGMPIEYLARAILFEGFTKNKWTPDMALGMLKILMAMIISIVVQKGVKPKIFNPDKAQMDFLDNMLDVPEDPTTANTKIQQDTPVKFTGLLGMGA